jgi:hypothetical protein
MRRGISALEIVLAIALFALIAQGLLTALAGSHASCAQLEDRLHFGDLAARVIDAAARQDFRFVETKASRREDPSLDWESWVTQVLGETPAGVLVRSWIESSGDPDAIVIVVEVGAADPVETRGGRDSKVRYTRLLVRTERSLTAPVPL